MTSTPGDSVADMLAGAYALDGVESSRNLYARWAPTYDSGFVAESGYRYHIEIARLFAAASEESEQFATFGPDEAIVDIGCGTGLTGKALRELRTLTIDGLDLSPEMLREAALKRHADVPVYRKLFAEDLTQISAPAVRYSGAVSAGTFTHGHVGPNALDGVLTLLRPGGLAVIGINAAHFESAAFGAAFDVLVTSKRIRALRFHDAPIYAGSDMSNPDDVARIAMFESGDQVERSTNSNEKRTDR